MFNKCSYAASFDKSSYKKAVYFIRQSQRLKSHYRYFMSMICSQAVQCEPVISVNRNKDKYKQYRRHLCYLTQNIHHDAVSCWLMLASFYYQMKQYNTVFYIIYYALSKCTPESILSKFFFGLVIRINQSKNSTKFMCNTNTKTITC
jgi:hypothetical protein